MIEVVELDKTFCMHLLGGKEVHALKGVTFSVGKGEFLGVAGRSGSGKSTLLKCIYRTCRPTGGSILYASSDGVVDMALIPDLEVVGVRREMGYVTQFLRPVPRVTALDMVAEPLRDRGVDGVTARREAMFLLDQLGLPSSLWDSFPVLFSGGEQQKVNIARALITRPRLLLLDEPTAALDQASRMRVAAILEEAKEAGVTMIGVFHDREMLYRLADRVLHLDEGKVKGFSGKEGPSMRGGKNDPPHSRIENMAPTLWE